MRFSLCIFISLCAIVGINGQTGLTNWADRISSKKKYPLTYWISPHANAVNVLIIDGKRFEHVRGVDSFFLKIPQSNAIVFVVDEKDYSVTYHVHNMDTGADIAITARNSVFGHTIGSVSPLDRVEVESDGIIVLCHQDPDARSTLTSLANLGSLKSLYYLDLRKRTVSEKTFFYDKSGKVILEQGGHGP
jgi:hypothetical protein